MTTYDPNRPYRIINRKSGTALSVAGTGDGERVILWNFVNSVDQLWQIVDKGGGSFRIENRHSGKVLSTLNRGSEDGTIIQIREDLANDDQYWTIDLTTGFFKIANRKGGGVVSCLDGGTANNTTIHLWHYIGDQPDQEWSIEPVPQYDATLAYRIINRKSGKDLSVYQAGSANGSRAILYEPKNAEDQRWHIVDLGNGFYKLVNNHSGRVLSTLDGGSTNGTIIHLWDDLTTPPDQFWIITPVGDNFVKITNRLCGRAVSCLDGGTENNTTIHLWDYLGGFPDQEWSLVPVLQHVDVDAHAVIANVSPYMTGVCMEDVNHEIYGGIDSQMIFGESFQEPPTYDPNALYKIINVNSGTALSVRLRGSANGSLAIIWDFVNAPDQFWRIADIGDGFYKIINHHSGRVLSTLNGGSTNGTVIHLWDDLTTFPDQHWAIPPTNRGFVAIMSRTSRRVVSCLDAGKANNTRVHLFDYIARFNGDIKDQYWQIEPVPPGTVSGMWRALSKGGAAGSYSLVKGAPFQGSQSQKMTYISGSGEIGIENQSLNRWGMNIEARKPYDGYLYIRTSAPTTVYVAFESQSGTTVYAETSFTAYTPHWTRYDFTLTPNNSDPHGRFAIKLKESGSIDIGYAFVQPGAWGRFKNLPVRKDIAEGLAAQGNTFLRFGGSSVGSLVIDVGYRWKNMIGPRDARFATGGLFNPYGTNGWGIFEFLNLVEAMGVVGIPAVSINESSQDISAFIEYVNGPISTTGGQQRAADGHPEPYRLRYLELGNEEVVDENYFRRFKDLATAIWRKDPDIILIVGDLDPGSDLIGSLFHWHLQILNLARDQGREVWFDFHIWADDVDLPYQRYDAKVLDQVKALDTLFAPLSAGVPGAKYKFVVFELNANSYDAHRALANAIAIGALQRLGDKVRMVASANALQPDEQNDNVWDQGLLFFNPRLTWAQPPYYVTQMKARNYLPLVVNAQVSGRESVTFDVTVTRSADGHTLALHVVNTIDVARTYAFNLRGFHPQRNRAHVTTLAGARGARNSPAHLDAVAPSEADVPLDRFGDAVMFTFAPNSFTIVRLQ